MPNDCPADGVVRHAAFRAGRIAIGIAPADASSHLGTLAMLRLSLFLVGLLVATTFSAGGCRSCSNCHDYDPPVAACDCHACGTERAGSGGGHAGHEYESGHYVHHGEAAEQEQAPEPEQAEGVEP
jgi:hypothetical protein